MYKFKFYYVLFFSFLLCLSFSLNLYSVPAPPFPVTYQQEDGTKFKVRLFGDERYIHVETIDGYTIVEEGKNWYYAERGIDGNLVSTGIMVGKQDPKAIGLEKHILPLEDVLKRMKESRLHNPLQPKKRRPLPWLPNAEKYSQAPELAPPIEGTGQVLVILADFPPGPQRPHRFTVDDFYALLGFTPPEPPPGPKPQKEIGENGTMNDYFKENSYGVFDVNGEIVGWVSLTKNYADYCAGASGMGTYPNNSQGLCVDLIKAIDQNFDFTNYDTDGDGNVDSVIIVFEGLATGSPNLFWPHAWSLGENAVTTGEDLIVNNYCIVNEQQYNELTREIVICQIGTFCHEYAHVLGSPDLYDYNPDPTIPNDPVSGWCLMAIGCYGISNDGIEQATPSHMTGFIKSLFMGWLTPTEITQDSTYQIYNLETYDDIIPLLYKVGIPGKTSEYFLIENRNPSASGALFDKNDFYGNPDPTAPGPMPLDSGLIIAHIDENMPDGFARFNDGPPYNSHYGMFVQDLGEPDDLSEYPWQYKFEAAFCKSDNEFQFTPNTYPYHSNAYDETWSGIGIVKISEPGETMTFTKITVPPPLLYISYFDPGASKATSISNPLLSDNGKMCFVALGATKANYPGKLYSFDTKKSDKQGPNGPVPITQPQKAIDTGAYPVTIAAGYNKTKLAVMSANDNIISIYDVDMKSGDMSLASIFKPYGSVFNKYTGLILHPTLPIGYAASQDDTIGMPGAIYVFSLTKNGYFYDSLQKILIGNNPQSIYLNATNQRLALVNAEGSVQTFDVNDTTGLLTSRGKFTPPDVDSNGIITSFNGNNVVLSPDGSKGYIAGRDEGIIFVFNATRTGNYSTALQSILTGDTPLYIAMNSWYSKLAVICADDEMVYYYTIGPTAGYLSYIGDVIQRGQSFTDVPITGNMLMVSNGTMGFAPCRPTGRIVVFDTSWKKSQTESLQFVSAGDWPTRGGISEDESVYAVITELDKITRIYRVFISTDVTDWELFE